MVCLMKNPMSFLNLRMTGGRQEEGKRKRGRRGSKTWRASDEDGPSGGDANGGKPTPRLARLCAWAKPAVVASNSVRTSREEGDARVLGVQLKPNLGRLDGCDACALGDGCHGSGHGLGVRGTTRRVHTPELAVTDWEEEELGDTHVRGTQHLREDTLLCACACACARARVCVCMCVYVCCVNCNSHKNNYAACAYVGGVSHRLVWEPLSLAVQITSTNLKPQCLPTTCP